jgi:hypothetical protein
MDINTRVPLLMIIPSTSWNITLTLINNVKLSLASIKNWSTQGHCGTNRRYLKHISTNPKLKKVYLQAKAFIDPFLKHIVTQRYKCLTYYKVGAIRSWGEKSHLELTGSLHCNYLDDVNKKTPNERPQSIIVALNPFNLLYECNMDDDLKSGPYTSTEDRPLYLLVPFVMLGDLIGLLMTKSMYTYIVSEEVDYPPDLATRVLLDIDRWLMCV